MKRSELKQIIREVIEESLILEADDKDFDRIKKINEMPKDKQVKAAELMASKLTNPDKAWGRYLAAKELNSPEEVIQVFLNKADELNHPGAVKHFKAIEDKKIMDERAAKAAARKPEIAKRFEGDNLSKATAADLERLQKIVSAPGFKQSSMAHNMSDKIKDPEKAWGRYLAAKQLDARDYVSNAFLARAAELGHDEAIKELYSVKGDIADDARREEAAKKRMIQPTVNSIMKEIKSKFPQLEPTEGFKVGSMYPGVKIGLKVPNRIYTSNAGETNITSYKKEIIGDTLTKVATIVNRLGGSLYYKNGSVYINVPFLR
jgi:hypothetical protein